MSEYSEIMLRLTQIEQKIKEPLGHFWVLVLLILIAIEVGACG